MKKYYCNNPKLENFLSEYGIEPRFYLGKTAVYKHNEQL